MTGFGPVPGWVKAAGTLSATSALILITFYLVYASVETSHQDTTALHAELRAIVQSSQDMQGAVDMHIQHADTEFRAIHRLLQQICVNTATTDTARLGCFP